MEKSLNWVKKAFNRTIEFKNASDITVGTITFKLFNREIKAVLNNKNYTFDIEGIFTKEVTVLDELNQEVARLQLGFNGKAEAQLNNGEKYIWKRADFFMRKWELIHDLPFTENDPVIINYDRERNFFNEQGQISLLESNENTELLTLIGFFIGFYFLRRRRRAAVAAS